MPEEFHVRIVELEPLHVACAHAFGPEPEMPAWEKLMAWAEASGAAQALPAPRLFGFNNPNPSHGSPNYGYEVWMVVPPGTQASGEVRLYDCPGGLYAVSFCRGAMNIPSTWHHLAAWVETSPYRMGRHQWLEEHLKVGPGIPPEEMELDLYCPICK